MFRRLSIAAAVLGLALLHPGTAGADARLVSVVAHGDGCVAGPTGPNVEEWDVEAGMTYTVRLGNVFDAAHAGTDPTLGILVMSSALGNIPRTATLVSTGVYEFDYTVPRAACQTSPIRYGVIGTLPNTGLVVGRHDTGTAQAHLRTSVFSAGCKNPVQVQCVTGTSQGTWGSLKSIYR